MTKPLNKAPKDACRFAAGEVIVESNGDGSKSTKFSMVARSGRPIEHPYWGRVVHDLSGMSMERNRVAIDYNHDATQPIGYANKFNIENGDLEVSGALTPVDSNDAASRVLAQAEAGVPFEASINFGGSGIQVEQVPEGESTEVNGYEFEGPGCVVRRWPLRGIAVCLYGADQYTSTEFSDAEQDSVNITPFHKEEQMADEKLFAEKEEQIANLVGESKEAELEAPVAEEVAEEVKAEAESVEDVEAEAKDEVEAEAVEEVAVEAVEAEFSGAKFMETFGREAGAIYFAEGKSYAEAMQCHFEALKAENEELRSKVELGASLGGEEAPVSSDEKKAPKEVYNPIRLPEGF